MAFGLTITRVKVRGSMETVMFLGDPRSGTLLKAGLTWWFNVKSSLEGVRLWLPTSLKLSLCFPVLYSFRLSRLELDQSIPSWLRSAVTSHTAC